MTQRKALVIDSGHQTFDELDATDIPALAYEASGAVATHAAASDPHPTYTTAAELAAYAQPLDADLTAIAALTTTAYGRAFLTMADAAAARTALSLWTETEVDFGTTPVWSATFTVTDAAVSGTSKVVAQPSGNVATGRVGNDLEWDNLLLGALPNTGTFTLTALAMPGPIVGKRKVYYQVS